MLHQLDFLRRSSCRRPLTFVAFVWTERLNALYQRSRSCHGRP